MKLPKTSFLDLAILASVAAGLAYLAHRVAVGMGYDWDWAIIPQYFIRFDDETQSYVPNLLLNGLLTTIRLSVWSTLLATILGLVMGLSRLSRGLFHRLMGWSYVESVRNLPPLVLVFIIYYFLSEQLLPTLHISNAMDAAPGWVREMVTILFAKPQALPAFLSAVFTLALYEGAYITEIIRAGIQSVEKGQWEAAYALGLSSRQRMQHVILPQAMRRILPPLGGQFISTIKDSAIVSIISIQELTFQGMELMSATYLTFEVWITVFLLYLSLTLTCSLAVNRLEKRMAGPDH